VESAARYRSAGGALKKNEFALLQKYAIRITLPQQVGGTAIVEIVAPDISVSSQAEGINESGDVTGRYQLPGPISRAFVYTEQDGMIDDIGDLGGDRAAGFAINNHCEITGYSENADGERHAFLFIPGEGMQDLGIINKVRSFDPGGNSSNGNDLNDWAVVVGISVAGLQSGSPVDHAFRETSNGMDDLGTLDGYSDSKATSINFDGEIVGWSFDWDLGSRGFLYSDSFGMLELDALIVNLPSANTGIIGGNPPQINDAGKICGTMFWWDEEGGEVRLDGHYEAYLLTPN
jgi:probable HAF family extracellular repeat protein